MFELRSIKSLKQIEDLLHRSGLCVPKEVDYTVGAFDMCSGNLIGTGSLRGDMIQALAIDTDFQGVDLLAHLVTHLIEHANASGMRAVYLFTKPSQALKFEGLGFTRIADASDYATLLEWGTQGITTFVKQLKALALHPSKQASGIVVNCNPFTLGHQFLIEYAASRSDWVFVIVVEEDQSVIPFEDRFAMILAGTAHIKNVTVVPGGRYVVSSLTFPSYFTREADLARAHSVMDITLFRDYIAPSLHLTKRFVGTEPYSEVTNMYNEVMKALLPQSGVEVVEIPRLEGLHGALSASRVRRLLQEGQLESIREFVPQSTLDYFRSDRGHELIQRVGLCKNMSVGYIEDCVYGH